MEWNRKSIRNILLILFAGLTFYVALQHLNAIVSVLGGLLGILSPFLIGCAIAFVLNVPMRALERHLRFRSVHGQAFRRPLALIITLACVIGVFVMASAVVLPNVGEAITSLAGQIPGSMDQMRNRLQHLSNQIPGLSDILTKLQIDWAEVSQRLLNLLEKLGNRLLSSSGTFLTNFVGRVVNFVIGFVFSIYILMQKERLGRQGRQCLYALLPESAADRTMEILALASKTFAGFLSGQCLEACILGTMFVVAMSIFRMPYALLTGVLIALTALIPIVGAFIGCAVGFLLIAMTDPWKALMFVVLFLVLQQIEGNLIYPHVVGSSVGLPSIWVLAAVTIGGKLFGIGGMVVFIPLCSVLYALFRKFIFKRLKRRRVPPDKWNVPEGNGT
ncbi:MAG: AI-2E family transporter [Oscillibacter sp.]|nr:AI-2E family transporter [Oscillibacter sp.]